VIVASRYGTNATGEQGWVGLRTHLEYVGSTNIPNETKADSHEDRRLAMDADVR
jgi:hypothetical protein